MFDTIPGGGGRVKRLSRRELQKIRANMAKVPKIKQKSDAYHAIEAQQADEMLSRLIIESDTTTTT